LVISKSKLTDRFSEELVWNVWSKALVVSVSDALVWRKDDCGAWIVRGAYGNKDSQYGWEIDHIIPRSQDGTDDISNLRPLQWENVSHAKDKSLKCRVSAEGTENVKRQKIAS
jgi:hypothetical protein